MPNMNEKMHTAGSRISMCTISFMFADTNER